MDTMHGRTDAQTTTTHFQSIEDGKPEKRGPGFLRTKIGRVAVAVGVLLGGGTAASVVSHVNGDRAVAAADDFLHHKIKKSPPAAGPQGNQPSNPQNPPAITQDRVSGLVLPELHGSSPRAIIENQWNIWYMAMCNRNPDYLEWYYYDLSDRDYSRDATKINDAVANDTPNTYCVNPTVTQVKVVKQTGTEIIARYDGSLNGQAWPATRQVDLVFDPNYDHWFVNYDRYVSDLEPGQ